MRKIIVAMLLLGGANVAQADIIPVLSNSSPVAVGNLYAYTYIATLAADQSLMSGNFFTIYDFEGFEGFGPMAAGFTASAAMLGRTPDLVLPFDSASVMNLTFTYNGPTINLAPGTSTELGSFTAYSRFNGLGLIDFASEGTKNNGFAIGTPIANVGLTAGPLDGGGAGLTVPEPATWAMLTFGFGLIGASMRRRKAVSLSA